MSDIYVNFLWHMHQPVYKDPLSSKYLMPWVRLHAIKGYYDMVHVLKEFPHIHQTFNLVPSLLMQIEDYVCGNALDDCLICSRKVADDLTDEDKNFLLTNFFMANWDTMIKPYPRYWELLSKRGFREYEADKDVIVKSFSTNDYRDLQVYFNLTWFGYKAREDFPFVQEMIDKGKDYTEKEKNRLLDIQIEVMKTIIPVYKSYQDKGQIEITVSPFYHPILPLVIDTDIAKRSMPHAPLPERFRAPDDALKHIQKSVDYYNRLFGKKPNGMWPSEGSVCPELIPLLDECGIKWIATDEEVLMNSIQTKNKGLALYKPYIAEHKGKNVAIVFRDHGLSDLIGFVYSKAKPEEAADDLISHITRISDYLNKNEQGTSHIVNVILDGENPWEYYPDGGKKFLTTLYEKITNNNHIHCVTVSEYLVQHPPKEIIKNLFSGSWICSNYDIWIGSKEENTGWEYIKRTREFLVEHSGKNKIPEDKLALAWNEIYAAEGSDWFWWYGDDFSTDNDELFDELFRLHLSNVYTVLDVPVPEYLNIPVITADAITIKNEPIGFIKPKIDGRITDYYEWQEAGLYNVKKPGGTMHKAESYIAALYYGFSKENLYFRLDPVRKDDLQDMHTMSVHVHFMKPSEYDIVFSYGNKKEQEKSFSLMRSEDGVTFDMVKKYETIAAENIIELAIPFKELQFNSGEEVNFFVQLKRKDLEVERYPKHGFISYRIPDDNYEAEMWSV
ncbi:MAG: glycoside hydrolase family 57 protein [Candidatus Ancaeobacter aquaticus]|nr:glycoside hydrolase family 57 protein [Candidatus Ancaeobacter aquaticus]